MSVEEFYANRCVLVTGASGFLGKVLVEKLLRSVPTVKFIYLIIRPQNGQDAAERLKKILKMQLFDKIRSENPHLLAKLIPIDGDLSQPNVGLTQLDMNTICEEVSVVINCAACIKFDEALRLSVEMNVVSLQRIIALCHKVKNLVSFVHTSTAYANCDRPYIEERVYPPPIMPQKLIDAMEWMSDDMIDALAPSLIGKKPNTYTFTKSLAEFLLVEEGGCLPAVIVRPSIIGCTLNDPLPGWVDNWNGPTGILAAVGKGLLMNMVGNKDAKADLIPVDYVSNLVICAAYYLAVTRPKVIPVINCCTGSIAKPFTWGRFVSLMETCFLKNPLNTVYRVPFPRITMSRLWCELALFFNHLCPAYVVDLVCMIIGKRPAMVRTFDKIQKARVVLEYFTSREWDFETKNTVALWQFLSVEDQKTFHFDARTIDWNFYVELYCLGVKRFMMKEELASLPKAREKFKRLKFYSTLIKMAVYVTFLRLLVAKSKKVKQLWNSLTSSLIKLTLALPGFAM